MARARRCRRPRGTALRGRISSQLIQIIIPSLRARYQSAMALRRGNRAMTKLIPDKAEVALEYPDKLYIGTFERSSRFEAHFDDRGISLTLDRPGEVETRKTVHMHVHYALFAEILCDLARTASSIPPGDATHRDALRAAAEALYRSLGGEAKSEKRPLGESQDSGAAHGDKDNISDLTPEEEVLLLHVLE